MKLLVTLLLSALLVSVQAQICDPNLNSLRFDGHSYVGFPANNDLNIHDEITVEAWIKATSWAPSSVQGSIVCKHGWSLGEKGFVLRAGGNGILSFTIAGIDQHGTPVGWKEIESNAGDLQLNTWHHVAGTFDGNKLRIYIDGTLAKSKNFKGSIDPSLDYNLKIGRIADDNTADKRYWTGMIDEVRIWKTALSQSTIDANKNEQIDPSAVSDLVGYWQLNEGSGTAVNDLGTAGCNGSLQTATWDTDVPFTNGIPRPLITQLGNNLISSSLTGNQWNLNGIPIPGATGISYTPVTGGDYTVTATYTPGCSATSIVFSIVFTSIDEAEKNPFSVIQLPGRIIKVVSKINLSHATVTIFDLNGKKLNQQPGTSGEINLSTCANGIYFVAIQSDEFFYRSKFFLN
jgi:hypothetical protein